MAITIPKKLLKYLTDDNNKWQRCVENLIAQLEPIIGHPPEFFPQYTDHGLGHVNTVLELAANLIHSKSLGKSTLASRDVACLIVAILIHDLGMFLTPQGLKMLLTTEWEQNRIRNLDKHSWSVEWDQYITSIKRLPEDRMIRIFGKCIDAEDTTLEPAELKLKDKLVIGEFLRRHHPRLAHEIAANGLPGSKLQHFLKDAGFDPTECNAIGLIARSHGMSLRKVEEHIGTGTHLSNLPVYYLMSVLRLADYLDASEQRAPMVRLNQEALTSPLSEEEWALNQCFRIDSSRWYPENKNYTINATPNTSSEYARLEKWLNEVQRELDQCWAMIAEKYPKSKLKLSIHRIKCTMNEKTNYEELSANFLPREAKITANPEIVKLMMEPLYGKDPTYGVRELLQNAVDACLERKNWEEKHGNPNYKGLVEIRIEGDTFTITDNGMGMNEDVLLNYYLCAGASYRSSDAWAEANAPEGKSQVARTGKFGVGFLASFLLGDTVEVHTQHVLDKEKGYHFCFDRESKPLDIKRERRTAPGNPFGTTITIQLHKDAHRNFHSMNYSFPWYNWYAFDEPEVRYFIDGHEVSYEDIHLCRDPDKNEGWLTLFSDKFEVYQWHPTQLGGNSRFFCNGIRIYTLPVNLVKAGMQYYMPHVSIIDKNGKLDVDLARRKLKSFPQHTELIRDLFRWNIARLLVTRWDEESYCEQNCRVGFSVGGSNDRIPFLMSSKGYQLNHATCIPILDIKDHVIFCIDEHHVRQSMIIAINMLPENTPFCIIPSDAPDSKDSLPLFNKEDLNYFLRQLLTGENERFHRRFIQYDMNNLYGAVWFLDMGQGTISNRWRDAMRLNKIEYDGKLYTSYHLHRPSQMPISKYAFLHNQFLAAVHILVSSDSPTFRPYVDSLFTQTLKEILTPSPDYLDQSLWIPFDMAEREKKFPRAFEELAVYMNHIRKYPIE